MIVKTSKEHEYEISDDALDDYEFLELMLALDKGESADLPAAFTMLLGKEGEKRAKDYVRGDNGRDGFRAMAEELNDIIISAGSAGKNS